MIKKSIVTACILSGAVVASFSTLPSPASAADNVSFEKDILPVLANSCTECHSAKEDFSNLRLDNAAGILKGGDLGTVVEPGNPDESPLYLRVALPQDDLDFMPVEGDPLTEDQVETLRLWIEQGADFGGWTGED